jgi:hypothetical protein
LLGRAPADKIDYEIDVGAIADHRLARFSGYRRRPKEPGRPEALWGICKN